MGRSVRSFYRSSVRLPVGAPVISQSMSAEQPELSSAFSGSIVADKEFQVEPDSSIAAVRAALLAPASEQSRQIASLYDGKFENTFHQHDPVIASRRSQTQSFYGRKSGSRLMFKTAAIMIPAASIILPAAASAAGVDGVGFARTPSGAASIHYGVGFAGTLLTLFGLSWLKLGRARRAGLAENISRWKRLYAAYTAAVVLRAGELLGYISFGFMPEGFQLGQPVHLGLFLPLVYGVSSLAVRAFKPPSETGLSSFPFWLKAFLPFYVISEIAIHHAGPQAFWVHVICGSFNLFCVGAAIFEGVRRNRRLAKA